MIPFLGTSQERDIPVNTDWDNERHAWESYWISHPTASVYDYGVYHFRNTFLLKQIPDQQIVHISADNRYRLFINGKEIAHGPARSSLEYWHYETMDLTPWLIKGENCIAVEVFNLGEHRPVAQFSHKSAFIFQANGELGKELNTGFGIWRVIQNHAFRAIAVTRAMVEDYYVAGPCDSIDGSKYLWGWEALNYDDSRWLLPKIIARGVGRGYMHGVPWFLTPRTIPMMEQRKERITKIIRTGRLQPANRFLQGKHDLVIPPHSKSILLLDNVWLTVGYPEMILSGGLASKIKVIYAEALFDKEGKKGNRNDVENKTIRGYYDVFAPDGGDNRVFRPLWLRTFRFIQLEISTSDQALIIHDYYNIFTAYPFEEVAQFQSSDRRLQEIWDVGWRTARLCAGETYMDCPYWEQLQYIGDTRIQSLISLYVTGDDRLMRNALMQIDHSRIPEGLTFGRAPSYVPQITPPFSLYWVDMVYDYFMHRPDTAFVKSFLPGIQCVLGWFERRIDANGMLGPLDWFNFSDWTPGFQVGAPAGVDTSSSTLISLNYAYALDRAGILFDYFKFSDQAQRYQIQSSKIKKAVYEHCFEKRSGYLRDAPDKTVFSQHSQIWGVLTDAIPMEDQANVMTRMLTDTSLIQTTIYFTFYTFQALHKVGMANTYLELLGPWYAMLDKGLSTFEEGDYDERSDCHAWGASPNYDLLATVCGIRPVEPGFNAMEIRPALGNTSFMNAKMPHPKGLITLQLRRKDKDGIGGQITIPPDTKATFYWRDRKIELKEGENLITIH